MLENLLNIANPLIFLLGVYFLVLTIDVISCGSISEVLFRGIFYQIFFPTKILRSLGIIGNNYAMYFVYIIISICIICLGYYGSIQPLFMGVI